MKTYLWIRKYVRLHPSGSGNSSLSREALAIEELVALKGCCEKKPDSPLSPFLSIWAGRRGHVNPERKSVASKSREDAEE